MRISELSRRSGVPTATIKYYLREGLLPAGRLTAQTQAQYDDTHLDRLRLIRALLGPGRLSIAQIHGVLNAVDDPPATPVELLGQASRSIESGPNGSSRARSAEGGKGHAGGPGDDAPPPAGDGEGPFLTAARELIDRLGWMVDPRSQPLYELADALEAIDQARIDVIGGGVEEYAEAIHRLATEEVATVPQDPPAASVRQAVLGTVLIEPLLLALRRLALQDASGRRWGSPDHRLSDTAR